MSVQRASIQRGTRSMIWRMSGLFVFLVRLKSPIKSIFSSQNQNTGFSGYFKITTFGWQCQLHYYLSITLKFPYKLLKSIERGMFKSVKMFLGGVYFTYFKKVYKNGGLIIHIPSVSYTHLRAHE